MSGARLVNERGWLGVSSRRTDGRHLREAGTAEWVGIGKEARLTEVDRTTRGVLIEK